MRIALLSWEFPPLVVGGIAAHVGGLSHALARAGHDVKVLTMHHPDVADRHDDHGVDVLRARIDLPWIPGDELVAQMASANHHVVQLAAQVGDWRPDVVHAHDWLMAWAGDTLARLWGVPLVATFHATERGRHGGHLPHGRPGIINSVEWWLAYQASEIICASRFMCNEVVDGFELPPSKVSLIPNGIDPSEWATAPADPTRSGSPLVLAWGRVQYEKGFQVLASALRVLRPHFPDVRCVIAGRGSYLPELQLQIDVEGVGDMVHLAGFVGDDELRSLLANATCAVIPSLYEPFGIVALEAMAAGAPLVAARTGGLAEILGGTTAGLLFEPGNPDDLAAQIARVLASDEHADAMRSAARTLLRDRYSWEAIAVATVEAYRRVT